MLLDYVISYCEILQDDSLLPFFSICFHIFDLNVFEVPKRRFSCIFTWKFIDFGEYVVTSLPVHFMRPLMQMVNYISIIFLVFTSYHSCAILSLLVAKFSFLYRSFTTALHLLLLVLFLYYLAWFMNSYHRTIINYRGAAEAWLSWEKMN